MQLLYLTLMNLAGAGSVGTGLSLLALLFNPFREHLAWSRYALTAVASIWYVPVLLVGTRIRMRSRVRVPMTALGIGLSCVIGGVLLSTDVDLHPDGASLNSY